MKRAISIIIKIAVIAALIFLPVVLLSGCMDELEFDGVSVGFTRIKTKVGYTEIDEYAPIVLLNLKSK